VLKAALIRNPLKTVVKHKEKRPDAKTPIDKIAEKQIPKNVPLN
jgi:hypothetical protein